MSEDSMTANHVEHEIATFPGSPGRVAGSAGPEARRGRGMGQKETATTNKNRVMIYGPKTDDTYVIEFSTAAGEALAISVPRNETVLKHFQERMPYELFVPDVP
jgi:hypothetical protein